LQSALQKASHENGETVIAANYAGASGIHFYNLLLQHLNITKGCPHSNCVSRDNAPDENGLSYRIKDYKTFNGNTVYSYKLDNGQFILNDGTFIMIEEYGPLISVDVNGYKKKPNKWGWDLFTFQLMNDGKLLPMGAEGTMFTDKNTYCSQTSTNAENGIACAYYAFTDENFWKELK
jgi:hypothetical protein